MFKISDKHKRLKKQPEGGKITLLRIIADF